MQLAAAGWNVTAVDLSEARMKRLAVNLARTKLSARTVIADALLYAPDAKFDAVLVDAPCSATGIFRRHPVPGKVPDLLADHRAREHLIDVAHEVVQERELLLS